MAEIRKIRTLPRKGTVPRALVRKAILEVMAERAAREAAEAEARRAARKTARTSKTN